MDNVIVVDTAAVLLLLLLANRALGIIKDGSIPMTLLLRMIGFSSESESESGDDEEETAFSTTSIGRARLRDTFDGDVVATASCVTSLKDVTDFFFVRDIYALLACIVCVFYCCGSGSATATGTGSGSHLAA